VRLDPAGTESRTFRDQAQHTKVTTGLGVTASPVAEHVSRTFLARI